MRQVKKFGNDANNRIFVRLDTDPLEAIERELGKKFMVQVGILGEKAGGRMAIKNEKVGGKSGTSKVPVVQGDSSLSNADIGLIHEKGSPVRNIPRRSFLEDSLVTQMPKMLAKVGAIILAGVNATNIELAYQKLAKIAETVVLQSFPVGGFGKKWDDLKKGGPSHLIKTGQLSQSISSRVVST